MAKREVKVRGDLHKFECCTEASPHFPKGNFFHYVSIENEYRLARAH